MSKEKVTFTNTGDGRRIGQAPWGAILRAPIPFSLNKGESRSINLGLRCSHVLLVVAAKSRELEVQETALLADDEIRVTFLRVKEGRYEVQEGDALVSTVIIPGTDAYDIVID